VIKTAQFIDALAALENQLVSKLQQLDCLEETFEVIFQQWQSIDRTTLNTLTFPTDEFVEFAASQLDKLTSHSFIAKSQAQKRINSFRYCIHSG